MLVPITISQNIQSGEPVFTNTRVPVKNLFDYLKAGHSLNEFLEDFPSVKKEQAIQVIEVNACMNEHKWQGSEKVYLIIFNQWKQLFCRNSFDISFFITNN